MKNLWNKLPAWVQTMLKEISRVILYALLSVLGLSQLSCSLSHVVRQSSTTTTTKGDGTTESISTTIEYDQSGKGSK